MDGAVGEGDKSMWTASKQMETICGCFLVNGNLEDDHLEKIERQPGTSGPNLNLWSDSRINGPGSIRIR